MLKLFLFAIVFSCFTIAIFLGILNILYLIQNKKIPRMNSITHGIFGLTGLSFLIITSYFYLNKLWICVVLFFVAALGGLYLFSYDLRKKKVPLRFALIHGFLASVSLFILIVLIYLSPASVG